MAETPPMPRGKPFPVTGADPAVKFPEHGPKPGNFYLVTLRYDESHAKKLQFIGIWDDFMCFYEDRWVREHPNSKPEIFKQTIRIYKWSIQTINDTLPEVHEVD